jgi:hypothetical protein
VLVALAAIALAAAGAGALVARGDAAATDAAARLAPADALLYVHASTAPGRDADRRYWALAGRFVTVRALEQRLLGELPVATGALDPERDVRPWLGDEVALAFTAAGGPDRPLLLAAVRDRGRAGALLTRLDPAPAGLHRGTPLRRVRGSGLVAAFAGGFLAVGDPPAVRGAIDRAAGAGPSLAGARVYRRAVASRPRDATVDVYAPAAGVRALLAGRGAAAAMAARLLQAPQVEGVAAHASAADGGVRLVARVLRAPGGPPRRSFEPSLAASVPAGASAYLGLPDAGSAVRLLAAAGAGPALEGLRAALPEVAGIELDRDLLQPLRGEAAVSVVPAGTTPVVTFAAATRDPARTREALARLQPLLAERLAGGAPFASRTVAGTPAFSLPVTTSLQPSYAVGRGRVVASTAESGLAQLRAARPALAGSPALRAVSPGRGERVEALGFLAPRELLALGERTGLAAGSPAVRDDLRRIRAVAVVVEEDFAHQTDTTAELFLQIP